MIDDDGLNRTVRFSLDAGAIAPAQARRGDAGLDLATVKDEHVRGGAVGRFYTGISGVHLPEWAFALVHTRSSTRERWGLEIRTSVIDAGYRGPLFIGYRCVITPQNDPAGMGVVIPAGTRLAQLVIMRNELDALAVSIVDEVDTTTSERGANGFGSTGA